MLSYLHPRLVAVLFLGFSSGLPRLLVASTLGALLTDNALEMSAIGLFAYVALPYSFNFLWAPLVDRFHLPVLNQLLGHRRSWMLLMQLSLLAAITLIGWMQAPLAIALSALVVAFFSASQDIVIDAFRTEYLAESQYGQGAAMAVLGYRLGMLVAGAGALYAAEYYGWQLAYTLMGLCMIVGVVTVLMVKEPHVEKREPPKDEILQQKLIAPFKDFMTRFEQWYWVLAFILLYRLSDGFIGMMTTPFMLDIGFDKPTIASIGKLYGFGATLAGMFVGGAVLARMPLYTALWSFGLFQLLANLAYMHLAYVGVQEWALVLAISMDNLSGGMVTAAAIAFMMQLCRGSSYTATQYALLSSLASLGSITLAGSAGWIAESYGWPVMFLLSAVLGLPSLWIIWRYKGLFKRHENDT